MSDGGKDAVAALYRLPLAEFTPARDGLAKRLAAGGDKAAAAEVKRLKKPSIPAWAANQVVWSAPREWRRLRDASAALRSAHETASAVQDVREAAREQRDALHECEVRAVASLEAAGHAVSPSVTMVISGTLLALAYGGGEPGRLERELPAPGFDVLLGLDLAPARATPATPSAPAASAAPARAPAPARSPAAASQAQTEARVREEAQAREDALRARAALAQAEAKLAEATREVDAAQAELTAIEERCRTLERELAAAHGTRDAARRALADARGAAAGAATELAALAPGAVPDAVPAAKKKGR